MDYYLKGPNILAVKVPMNIITIKGSSAVCCLMQFLRLLHVIETPYTEILCSVNVVYAIYRNKECQARRGTARLVNSDCDLS